MIQLFDVVAHLNDIEGHKGTVGVHHSHVDMKVASQTSEEYESKEDQKERYLGPIERVMVDVVIILPARPVHTRVREESNDN